MCGKNPFPALSLFPTSGSPPRVREKLITHLLNAVRLRITPACAGKTLPWSASGLLPGDHPRVCGKNFIVCCFSKSALGSPPRVREKLKQLLQKRLLIRITPACAGKTVRRQCLTHKLQDHPRVCGKNFFYNRWLWFLLGSPPRVREKHLI